MTLTQKAVGVSTDHSVVAVSKVLHFWNPELAPMIDANVVVGLKALPDSTWKGFKKDILGDVRKRRYLWYWELAFQLRASCQTKPVGYRMLDELLFQLGRTSV